MSTDNLSPETREMFHQMFAREIAEAVKQATASKQLSRADLQGMTPEQINDARKNGLLNDILLGRNTTTD